MATAPTHIPGLDLPSTLGAGLLGCLIAGILYGVTCIQTWIYFSRCSSTDRMGLRLVIFFLWLLDTVHLAFVTHGIYFYAVVNYGNPLSFAQPTWSVLAQVYITCVSDLIIRGIFGMRVWKLTGRSIIIATLLTLTSLATFVAGFAFTTKSFHLKLFSLIIDQAAVYLYIALASGVAADVLIATSLCWSLAKNRTGFEKTDSIINLLMVYAINTGLLTTLCSLACLITFAIWPHQFTFIGIYFALNKLFFNSLLAAYNGRDSMREKILGVSIPLSDISASRHGETTAVSTRSQPLVVNINKEVVHEYGYSSKEER